MGKHLNGEFEQYVSRLPGLMDRLLASPLRERSELGILPVDGVYVFYEDTVPMYVGRSQRGRMRTRIQEHSRESSNHGTAPFAFNIAKKAARKHGLNLDVTRAGLENEPVFRRLFSDAKSRVSRMRVRVIKIDDPILQTLFEVYATIDLGTREYNEFRTH